MTLKDMFVAGVEGQQVKLLLGIALSHIQVPGIWFCLHFQPNFLLMCQGGNR